ncbi:type IV toxin-antitoxin system AbiEi family antitoxin domain-containing protein [Microbulbifer sp.]|uniref:type IV toxin-antitoxin system AbiEi family antitoxin domain-containing protein n=1 Tax=Microbulbifer sp. TaxID=1908541 RepID=UPI003F34D548
MNAQKSGKLNLLEQALPEGLLVDSVWMERHGYYRSLRSQYVASGWLQQPARGVFRRPRGDISWEQVVVSLQALMGRPVTVGGRTAIELQGRAHYLPFRQVRVHLYCAEKLPSWLHALPIDEQFIVHNPRRLFPRGRSFADHWSLTPEIGESPLLKGGFRILPWGQWQWPLVVSSLERAYLELLDLVPGSESFHMADVIMEGLLTLSPRRLQVLLEECGSVKVRRLFFFFADRHQPPWLKRLNRDRIDLGSGKRMLVKGGKLDATYQITVPEEFMDGGARPGRCTGQD